MESTKKQQTVILKQLEPNSLTSLIGKCLKGLSFAASLSHHEQSDVGEEACRDDQNHHRPRKPEAQVFKDKPTEEELVTETRQYRDTLE